MAGKSPEQLLPARAAIGIVGAGTMGAGIAQVAAMAGHRVLMFDTRPGAAEAALHTATARLGRLTDKARITPQQAASSGALLHAVDSLDALSGCALVIEAIAEDLDAKRILFRALEERVAENTLLASNTSSLSITSIAATLNSPERVAGMHFFNPAPSMALVEIVRGLQTSSHVLDALKTLAKQWGKTPVLARSTPGFIVNRIARPFYGEALRLLSEGAADCATIDAVMREAGGFRMGPFELMDLIGQDVNFAVTQSIFEAHFGDPRYTPSLRQKELVDAGFLGRKTGRGFYTSGADSAPPAPHNSSRQAAPSRLRLFGDDPLAWALMQRLAENAIVIEHAPAEPDQRIAEAQSFTLYRTDGRTATQRAADLRQGNLVLVDLACDYASAGRIAFSVADQAAPSAANDAAGMLQAAGFAASRIDDAAGLIVMRTVAMLATEAADAVLQGVASVADCDLAMQLGTNYPRGPLAWADTLGAAQVVRVLDHLASVYGEDRYRASPLLRRNAISGILFHPDRLGQPARLHGAALHG